MRQFSYKQVIVIRMDLKMSKGKTAVQAAHGSLSAYKVAERYYKDWADNWFKEGQKKVAVKVDNEQTLMEIAMKAKIADLPFAIINDAGLTELTPGTTTVIGIGPAPEQIIDKVTGHLKLL